MPGAGAGGGEGDRRARVLLSVLEDLREERERLAHQTERRRLAEQRFRATIEAAPTSMVMIDAEGRITLVNAQTEALFGYPRAELLGAAVETLLPEDLRATHPGLREAFFHSPRARAMGGGRELFGRRKDGSLVPVEIGLSPVATDEGLFVLSAIVDITERRRLAEAQQRLNAELERRVEERTAELAVARDAAQAANRAKSEFLANMSHEIRTPLNAIVALSEVLSQSELDPVQREHVDIVIDSAEALLAVINDLLDFSKIEAGKLALESVPFDLHDLLDSTLKPLLPRALETGIELGLFVAPEIGSERLGDPGRLRQVLSNLLSNALKFTAEGEVELRVVPAAEPTQLRFEVRDTGVGLREQESARLFQPFEQADSSTTRRFGGTGLGLSISRQLVELMGGEIGVQSELGAGSTFHFVVPLAAAGAGSGVPLGPGGDEVLVASPSAMLRRNVEELLSVCGHRVAQAATADAVLAALRCRPEAERSPPWLLLDAELGAPALLDRIRRDSGLARPRLALIPRLGERPEPELCRALEVEAVLARPVGSRDLLRALRGAGGAEGAEVVSRAAATGPDHSRELAGLRVLLAEDSGANRKVAEALLAEHVACLDFVGNGTDALAALRARSYDLVLMDVQMPDMDGLEATARIRSGEIPGARELPIIALTAHALGADRDQCLEAGMDGYVSKPVRRDELFAAIASAVGGQPRSRGKTGLVSRSS